MVRTYMLQIMRREFGDPTRTREHCQWWEFERGGHADLHVCLDAPARPHLAHILIFDPCGTNDDAVVDVTAHTQAEADAIVESIRARLDCEDVSHSPASRLNSDSKNLAPPPRRPGSR